MNNSSEVILDNSYKVEGMLLRVQETLNLSANGYFRVALAAGACMLLSDFSENYLLMVFRFMITGKIIFYFDD